MATSLGSFLLGIVHLIEFDPDNKSDTLTEILMGTRFYRFIFTVLALASAAFALSEQAFAQSTDQNLPSPVLAKEISGRIDALDLGDPRATRHYYAFSANPGDLLITVEGHNLNGDVDVFTAITLRPLMKTTMIATSQSGEITKGIYLRAHQILILRVEARTPNDDPGSYHIRFSGTFEPFSGGIPVAENAAPAEPSEDKGDANRLSSVGATIPRPVTETAEAKTSTEKTPEETESPKKPVAKPSPAPRRNTARNTRRNTRTAPPRRTPAPKPTTETAKEKPAETGETPAAPAETTTTTKPATEKPANQELPQAPGTRLIIQQKDGTTINRPMSTVRRVVIEGPAIVIVLKTGKIERIAMANVARMSIEPE